MHKRCYTQNIRHNRLLSRSTKRQEIDCWIADVQNLITPTTTFGDTLDRKRTEGGTPSSTWSTSDWEPTTGPIPTLLTIPNSKSSGRAEAVHANREGETEPRKIKLCLHSKRCIDVEFNKQIFSSKWIVANRTHTRETTHLCRYEKQTFSKMPLENFPKQAIGYISL